MIVYLRKADAARRLHVALGLLAGGAIGNLIDRVAYGRVTDFIVWNVGTTSGPRSTSPTRRCASAWRLMVIDMLKPRPAAAASS